MVPVTLRDASYALGARQWQTVLRVSVPAALPAIVTGVFLAIARIAGETAPLLLTCGDSTFWPRTFLKGYTPTLPRYVYNYARSAYPEQNQQAWNSLRDGQACRPRQPGRLSAALVV
jgi:phosphate transport system permease protein